MAYLKGKRTQKGFECRFNAQRDNRGGEVRMGGEIMKFGKGDKKKKINK